jgi:hypothetical protein
MSAVVSDSQSSPARTKRTDGFLLLLLLASLSLNVYLGWKVKQGKTTSIPQNTFTLSPGMKVDPFTAVGLDGKQQTISYAGTEKPTVFYVLSPTCVWCERNKANIEKLVELKGNDFRFIGLSLTEAGLKEYTEGHHLNFPMYTRLTSKTIDSLGLGGTPQTIVISPEGLVLKNWKGAYAELTQPEVEAYFGIRLPGLPSRSH